jgi:hypothetical protein
VVKLKDGRTVTLRPEFQSRNLKVRDVLAAQRLAKGDKEALPYAIVAGFILIDGEGVAFEDLMDMDIDDFAKASELLPDMSGFTSGQEK